MISGNQNEKRFRTKVMSVENNSLSQEEMWKISCDSKPESSNGGIRLKIDNLHTILKEKNYLVITLQTAKNNMEKSIIELQCQMKKLSDENNKYVNDIKLMKNDIKKEKKIVNNLYDELKELKIEYSKLEEHNQANKKQIDYSYEIDSELRNGKRNIINEINLLEPRKITGFLTDHNLSNLLDTFVNLIMTKELQIVTDHCKIKQQYEDKIKQMQEDIKKGKEWQEQVENDNEKLGLELEKLKLQKYNFPSRELKIKELTEKVLKAENLSFNYLSELQELKAQLSKTCEQNYQSLLHQFEVFKTSSEQSIKAMRKKLENLTKQYNEYLSRYKVQKSSRFSLEDQYEKIQSQCACLKSVIEEKDEGIKNLLGGFRLKTNEYETMIEKYNLQKEEMRIHYEKKINDLQFDLSNMKHKVYCTEKLLKELNKNNENEQIKLNMNNNSLIEVNKITEKLRTILKSNDTLPTIYENICSLMTKREYLKGEIKELKDSNVHLDNECESMLEEVKNKDNKITELLTQVDTLKQNIELFTEEKNCLRNKNEQFKNLSEDIKKLNYEICGYEQNIYELRKDKGQLIIQHNKELKQHKIELQEVQTKNLKLLNEYNTLSETTKTLEKSLKEDIQQLNKCIVDKNAKISKLQLFSKTYTDDLKKKNHDLEIAFERARDENHMLSRELYRFKEISIGYRSDQCTQTVEELNLVSSAMVANHKCMIDKIAKFEKDSKIMKMILHHRKAKIEELEKLLNERHC